jgi:hypothetical protein
MAQNTTKKIEPKTWTQLTDANVSSITFQNRGANAFVAGTAGTTPPSSTSGAILYATGQGELNTLMIDLFPGISAARVWAYCDTATEFTVSHA